MELSRKTEALIRSLHTRHGRRKSGLCVCEGVRAVGELVMRRPGQIRFCVLTPEAKPDFPLPGENFEINADRFRELTGTVNAQGILAVAERRAYHMADILGADPAKAHVLVLDNLQDPGNLGTIFRTAEAAGVNGIVLSSDCVDIYNPKVVRSTMGAVLRMPFLYVEDLPGAIGELKKEGILVYAAHLAGERAYDEEDYTTGCAFLIGNEGNGLRDEVAACADRRILIPMCGRAESLNAAVAAAVLMFEAGRQRRK